MRTIFVRMLPVWAAAALLLSTARATVSAQESATGSLNFEAAAAFSAEDRGDAVVVMIGGEIVFEEYQNDYDPDVPHILASGTKSFSCAIAVAAIEDGLIASLDERAADTITEWSGDEQRSLITIRQLLSLTSGLQNSEPSAARNEEDMFADAVDAPLFAEPGEIFQYGPTNFFVFGEIMRRKLGDEPLSDYVQRRLFDPIGLEVGHWGADNAGNPDLAGGLWLTPEEWLKYGQLVLEGGQWQGAQILDPALLAECFTGTQANPHYGLTWWLSYDLTDVPPPMTRQSPEPGILPDGVTLGETMPEIIFAGGAFGQRMYLFPARDTIVLRLGRQRGNFDDSAFLSALFGE